MGVAAWEVDERDGVVVATHEGPARSPDGADGLRQLARLIDGCERPGVRAVVIASGDRPAPPGGRHALLQRLEDLRKPVIVAMTGDAIGGGLELALACDIRIAQRGDFRYGLGERPRVGLPGGHGAERLVRLIGAAGAAECMRGRGVSPERALDLGLVHVVAGDARDHAERLAHQLAALPPRTLAMIKLRAAGGPRPAGGRRLQSVAGLAAPIPTFSGGGRA